MSKNANANSRGVDWPRGGIAGFSPKGRGRD